MSAPSSAPTPITADCQWVRDQIVADLRDGLGIVPWIGAGLSIPYGYPGWNNFLKSLVSGTSFEAAVLRSLDAGDYEEAADLAYKGLGSQKFEDEFKRAFGKAPSLPSGPTAMREIARLSTHLTVTTNFEPVVASELEASFGAALPPPIEGAMFERVRKAIHRSSPGIWMIHGTAEEKSTRVLTLEEYKRHYIDPFDGAGIPPHQALLEGLFAAKRILFVGCSLDNDRTMRIMKEWALRSGNGHHHYAILEEPEPDQKDERIRFLSERQIRPIFYPRGQHGHVQEILKTIADASQPYINEMRRHGGRMITFVSRRAIDEAPCAPTTPFHLDTADLFEDQALKSDRTWAEIAESTRAFFRKSTAERIPVRLNLQAHLSLCAFVGSCLPPRLRIPILIEQSGEIWSAADDGPAPEWAAETITLGTGVEWALLIEAVPGARHDVTAFAQKQAPEIGTLVVLSPTDGHPQVHGGRHSQELVNAAVRIVQQRQGVSRDRPLHAFVVGPSALAFMLGQQSMALGAVQFYEYLRDGRRYVPSVII